MYELSRGWSSYYHELDPKRRRKMLDEMFMTAADDGANMYRLHLWEARYLDSRHPGTEVDRFLFQFVNMIQVYRSARIFRRSAARQARNALREMLQPEALECGAAGVCALYWEIRNAAMRYFKTCESSAYNRSLFGMVASGDAGRNKRICREAWEMTRGLTQRTGMHEELQVWNDAVLDAYAQYDAAGREQLETLSEKSK